jgi:hypothetical protein
LQIRGDAIEFKRVRVPCPDDGVHRASVHDGTLKGCHCVWFVEPDGKRTLVPKGQTAFYWRYKEDVGLKVFYKFEDYHAYGIKAVKKDWKNRVLLANAGLAPRAYGIKKVQLDIKYNGKRFKGNALAIKTDHVHVPESAWEPYSQGYPYDFTSLPFNEHPLHCPEGYRQFVEVLKLEIERMRITLGKGTPSYKLGDVAYCQKRKRWYIVDAG